MKWIAENSKDAKLINHVELAPLDVGIAKGDEDLAGRVDQHNAGLTELRIRFAQLADNREAMSVTDNWLDHDSAAVVTERRRLVAESWDVLVSLREALRARQAVLRQCEAHVAGQSSELAEQRQKAFAKAQRALTRKHSEYVKAEPILGPAYVEELAQDDEAVVDLGRQEAALNAIWERLQTMRRRATIDLSTVGVRQRGIIEYLTN